MRAEGRVRFIKISSRMQITAAAAVLAMATGTAGAMGVMAWNSIVAEHNLASYQEKHAQVVEGEEKLEEFGGDIEEVVEELNSRQDALDAMSEMLPEDIRKAGAEASETDSETSETVDQVGKAFPQARGLAQVEARQLAYVESMTRYANWRAAKAERALRKLSLDPRTMAQGSNAEYEAAMGGPLQVLATSADGSLDPRFERLGRSLARMSSLERALDGVPQVVPAANQRITSNFGYRRDPFNGRGAMHNGIDFKGPYGSDIYAAGGGEVSFAGWKSGYGKTVEITHSNGLMTRYAHLSRIDVAVGQPMKAGETLGGLGSTGRSTGPHLHFEVRINGRAVNPRPFLETAPDVLKEVRRTEPVRTSAR